MLRTDAVAAGRAAPRVRPTCHTRPMDRIPFLGETLDRLDLDGQIPAEGPLRPTDARLLVGALVADRPAAARQPLPGELLALSILHEAAHLAMVAAARRQPGLAIDAALPSVRESVGQRPTTALLRQFAAAFPGLDPEAAARLEDLLLVHLANVNPA